MMLAKGMTKTAIAKFYDRNRHTLTKWLQREQLKRDNATTETEEPGIKSKPSRVASAVVSGRSPAVNERLPKYGQLEPTFYISPLNHDDWIAKYCGFTWDLDYLTELRNFLWEAKKGMALEPRGHGKTLSVVGLFARFLAEVRKSIMNVTNGPAGSRRIFRAIKKIFESEVFRRDYGDIYKSANKSTLEIELKDSLRGISPDPDFKTAGLQGEFIGLHPFWIHYEDITQQESKNKEIKEDLEKFHEEVIKYCAVEDTKITNTSTRKGLTDFNWYLMEQGYRVLHKKAIKKISGEWPTSSDYITELIEDGGIVKEIVTGIREPGIFETLNCPNYSLQRLLEERTRNLESFESQMQNNPLPSSGLFFNKDDWIISEEELRLLKDVFISVDPGYGKGKKADNSAIVVAGIYNAKAILFKGVMDRLDPGIVLQHLVNLNEELNPHAIYMESNFWQILLKNAGSDLGLPVVSVPQDTNKLMRIDSLKIHFTERRILIHESCPIKDKLYIEYVQYAQEESKGDRHDDGLDALATMMIKIATTYLIKPIKYKIKVF